MLATCRRPVTRIKLIVRRCTKRRNAMIARRFSVASGLLAGMVLLTACSQQPREVSFKEEVGPILDNHCAECHTPPNGQGYVKSGLNLTTYQGLMKGTKFGPVVKPGDSLTSALIMLVEGRADPSIQMPHGKEPLSKQEIQTLKTWVEQGAKDN
jgi:Planctomycete cytochrome C